MNVLERNQEKLMEAQVNVRDLEEVLDNNIYESQQILHEVDDGKTKRVEGQ